MPGIRRIAVSLLVGAILTTVAAWALATRQTNFGGIRCLEFEVVDPSRVERQPVVHSGINDMSVWLVPCRHGERLRLERLGWRPIEMRGDSYILGTTAFRIGVARRVVREEWRARGPNSRMASVQVTTGWPFPALRGECVRTDTGQSPADATYALHDAWRLLDAKNGKPRILPYGIKPGFALNTLLFATLTWMATAAPAGVRDFARRRAGRCGRCGYPKGESERCTECGVPLD